MEVLDVTGEEDIIMILSSIVGGLLVLGVIGFVITLERDHKNIHKQILSLAHELSRAIAILEGISDDRRPDKIIQRRWGSFARFRVLSGGKCGSVAGSPEDTDRPPDGEPGSTRRAIGWD